MFVGVADRFSGSNWKPSEDLLANPSAGDLFGTSAGETMMNYIQREFASFNTHEPFANTSDSFAGSIDLFKGFYSLYLLAFQSNREFKNWLNNIKNFT